MQAVTLSPPSFAQCRRLLKPSVSACGTARKKIAGVSAGCIVTGPVPFLHLFVLLVDSKLGQRKAIKPKPVNAQQPNPTQRNATQPNATQAPARPPPPEYQSVKGLPEDRGECLDSLLRTATSFL